MPTVDLAFPANTKSISPSLLGMVISRFEHFAQDAGNRLHAYRAGIYVPADEIIKGLVPKILDHNGFLNLWSPRLCENTIEFLRTAPPAPRLWERPPVDELNLLNGILNIKSKKLRPHDPAFLSTVRLPVNFDPKAGPPVKWQKFIEQVMPVDAVEEGLIWAIIAWLMVPNMSLQKALLLMSEVGGTGKSTLLKTIARFLGLSNVSNIKLQDLETNRFKAAGMMGKLMNYFADLPGGRMESSSVFKVIVGEDPLDAERKFEQPFKFIPFARQCYSTNNFPIVDDAGNTDAFFDRWLVIPFKKKFRGTDEQRNQDELIDELCQPREFSGVLNEALKMVERVSDPVRGLPEPPSCVDARLDFEAKTSPVTSFLARRTRLESGCIVPKTDLLQAYNRDASNAGRPMMNETSFSRALKKLLKDRIKEIYPSIGGLRKHSWQGVGLMDETAAAEAQKGSEAY